jgi:hypothetical protein
MLTIGATYSVGPDGPEEMVWASLDGEKFIPVTGLEGWRDWTTAPAEVCEAIRDILTPEHDPITNTTRYHITYARRYLAMHEVVFREIEESELL